MPTERNARFSVSAGWRSQGHYGSPHDDAQGRATVTPLLFVSLERPHADALMTRLRRTVAAVLSLVLVVVIALAATWLLMMHRLYPHPPPADYPPVQDLATAQRQDLDYFRHYFDL